MPEEFIWGPVGGASTVRGTALRKEAAFAASRNPSSIFMGIHFKIGQI